MSSQRASPLRFCTLIVAGGAPTRTIGSPAVLLIDATIENPIPSLATTAESEALAVRLLIFDGETSEMRKGMEPPGSNHRNITGSRGPIPLNVTVAVAVTSLNPEAFT